MCSMLCNITVHWCVIFPDFDYFTQQKAALYCVCYHLSYSAHLVWPHLSIWSQSLLRKARCLVLHFTGFESMENYRLCLAAYTSHVLRISWRASVLGLKPSYHCNKLSSAEDRLRKGFCWELRWMNGKNIDKIWIRCGNNDGSI